MSKKDPELKIIEFMWNSMSLQEMETVADNATSKARLLSFKANLYSWLLTTFTIIFPLFGHLPSYQNPQSAQKHSYLDDNRKQIMNSKLLPALFGFTLKTISLITVLIVLKFPLIFFTTIIFITFLSYNNFMLLKLYKKNNAAIVELSELNQILKKKK